jgi:glutamate--cysteine ligase
MKLNTTINTKEELENFVCKHWREVNVYLETMHSGLPLPFYSSVDIRESREKYAPVDNNIYPAGFNNLCSVDLQSSASAIKDAVLKVNSKVKTIGIFPESHTKNLMYLEHLVTLEKVLNSAGFKVLFLSFDLNLFSDNQSSIDLESNSSIPLQIIKVETSNLTSVDLIICNNDQSNPLPIDWRAIQVPIVPTPLIGWFKREKNIHFSYYKKVADEFCSHFGIDSNLIQAKFTAVDEVDFENKEGLEKLGSAVDELIGSLPQDSKVFVKASKGTYGMGISVVSSGEEIINMNRKTRNKMDVGKNKIKFTSLLVQEGVETIIKYDDMPAEITVYLIDGQSIGGFMRINGEKDSLGNLNSRGMVFRKLCMCDVAQGLEAADHKTKEAMYSLIARLSTIAAAYEIKDVI